MTDAFGLFIKSFFLISVGAFTTGVIPGCWQVSSDAQTTDNSSHEEGTDADADGDADADSGDADTDVDNDSDGETDTQGDTAPTQLIGNPCDGENTPWECVPAGNIGCVGYEVSCDWGLDLDGMYGFFCFVESTEFEGDTCWNDAIGPYCGPGLVCIVVDAETWEGRCGIYCCENEDCPDSRECVPFAPEGVWDGGFIYIEGGELGFCE